MTTKLTEKRIDIYSMIVPNISVAFPEILSQPSDQELHNDIINKILSLSNSDILIEKISEFPSVIKEDFDKIQNQNPLILKLTSTTSSPSPLAQSIFACISLPEFILDLITCTNLLIPGALAIKKCYVFIDNKPNGTIDYFNFFSFLTKSSIYLHKTLYNKSLSLDGALRWLKKIPKDEDKNSTTSLGRAIGAINRLIFSDISEVEAMMWIIVALEAFYNEPTEKNEIAIIKQIVEKSKNITQSSINEKDLRSMYNARSNFLHGQTDFQIYSPISMPSSSKKGTLNRDHLNVALELLFKTLQFMIENKKYNLEFERSYQLK